MPKNTLSIGINLSSSKVNSSQTNNEIKIPKVLIFGISGMPGFVIAICLNYTLVDVFNLNIYGSYVIVLLFVSLINYFIVDNVVFNNRDKEHGPLKRFSGFISVIFTSRFLEWILYSIIIYLTNIYYIIIQIFVSAAFIFIKYYALKKIFK